MAGSLTVLRDKPLLFAMQIIGLCANPSYWYLTPCPEFSSLQLFSLNMAHLCNWMFCHWDSFFCCPKVARAHVHTHTHGTSCQRLGFIHACIIMVIMVTLGKLKYSITIKCIDSNKYILGLKKWFIRLLGSKGN